MIKVAAVLIALASAFATWQPPTYNPPLDKQLYVEYRQHKAELEKKRVETEKPAEVKPSAGAAPLILSNSPVINQFNQFRAQHGLPPVSESASLNASAQAWANTMASSGYRHSSYGAEIIAFGCPSVEAFFGHNVATAWYESPAHRAIMLGSYGSVGYGEIHSGGCVYHVAHFG